MVGLLAACGGGKQSENTENATDTSAQVNTQSTKNDQSETTQPTNKDALLSSDIVAEAK